MDYANIEPLLGAIISEGRATLQELRTIYTLEDAMLMWETIAVPRYNEWLAHEHARKSNR